MLFRLKTLSLPPSAAECCSDCWVITLTLHSFASSTISINSFIFLLFGEGEWEAFDLREREGEKERERERQKQREKKERKKEKINCMWPPGGDHSSYVCVNL